MWTVLVEDRPPFAVALPRHRTVDARLGEDDHVASLGFDAGDARRHVGLGVAGLPVCWQLEVHLVAARHAREPARAGRHGVELETHGDQAVVEPAVVVAVVALAAIGGADQVGRAACALAAAVQVEPAGMGGAVDLDVVVVEPVVRTEQRLEIGGNGREVDQVDVGPAPSDQRFGGERPAFAHRIARAVGPGLPLLFSAMLLQAVGQVGDLRRRQGGFDHQIAAQVEEVLFRLVHAFGRFPAEVRRWWRNRPVRSMLPSSAVR